METKTEMKLGEVFLHPTDRKLSFRCSECGLQMDLVQQFLMHSLQHVMCLGECEVTEIVSQAINGATTVKDTEECQERDEDTDIDKPDLAKVVEEEVAFVDTYKDCTSPSVSQSESDEELAAAEFLAAISTPPLEETTDPKVSEKFKCHRCATVVNTSKRLLRHMRVAHQESGLHMCDICGATFTTMSNCKAHTRRHTGVKAHTCEEEACGKSFHSANELRLHRRSHTDERPYKCTECAAAYKTSSSLALHRRRHLNERPHICALCGKAFATSVGMREHERTHNDERLFRCTLCDGSFKRAAALRQHMHLHSGKKFACEVCGSKFAQSAGLYSHMKSHRNAGKRTRVPRTTAARTNRDE